MPVTKPSVIVGATTLVVIASMLANITKLRAIGNLLFFSFLEGAVDIDIGSFMYACLLSGL